MLLPLAELVSAERVSAVSICATTAARVGTVTLTSRAVYGLSFTQNLPSFVREGSSLEAILFPISALFVCKHFG